MGISKLGGLSASNSDAIQQSHSLEGKGSKQQAKTSGHQERPSAASPSDAVVLSPTLRANSQQREAAETLSRAERVQAIQQQVRNGTYRSDSEKVAVAVMKDLA